MIEEITSIQGPSWFPMVLAFGRCTYTYDPATESVEGLQFPLEVTINGRDSWGRKFTKASFDRMISAIMGTLRPQHVSAEGDKNGR